MQKKVSVNRTIYPLTPAQKLPLFARNFTVHKQITNIPIAMFIEDDLEFGLLKSAVERAIERNDVFGLRLVKIHNKWHQYFSEHKVLTIELLDFTGQTDADMQASFQKLGRTVLKLDRTPLASLYLVKSPDGQPGIFAVINHLIMDSWSIGVFLKDIMHIYYALRDGTPMPKPIQSYEVDLQKDLQYLESDRYKNDLTYWRQIVAEETDDCYYTSIQGSEKLEKQRKKRKNPNFRFAPSFFLRTKASHEVILMDKDIVERMKEFCTANHYPMSLLIYMGLRTFYVKVNNHPRRVGSMNMVSRRSTLTEKATGGTRVQTILMGSSIIDEDTSFMDGLERLLSEQNEHYRHADLSALKIFDIENELHAMKYGINWRAFSYTFQPLALDLGNNIKIRTMWYCNGAAAQPIYITVMDGDGTGSLRFYYEYLVCYTNRDQIQKCHDYATRVIEAGMANPNITIRELLER